MNSDNRVLLGGALGGVFGLCLAQGILAEPWWLWLALVFAVLFGINLARRNTQ